ncbi:MAG: methyltransferase domain-containing protein [Nitrospiraceae bacterium]|nr:MAG: methyltransferase domain-containing protein [Nitrospiraceae bacterium]
MYNEVQKINHDMTGMCKRLEHNANLLIQQSLSVPDMEALRKKIDEIKPLNILAVGTSAGAVLLLASCSPEASEIHVIGPGPMEDRDSPSLIHAFAQRVIEDEGIAHKITWHVGAFTSESNLSSGNSDSSLDMNVTGPGIWRDKGPFDFIFMHSQDSEDAMLTDLELASRYLKQGGILAIDDTLCTLRPQVLRAIFRFMHPRTDYVFLQTRNWDPLCTIGFLEHCPEDAKRYSIDDTYDSGFYDRCIEMHARTVPHIARLIFERYRPGSVIDFGCGAGMWLKEFIKLGVKEVRGVDASRTAIEQRNSDISEMVAIHNLGEEYMPGKKFDICLCLDVIEHLQPEYEDNLIRSCVNASDTIIFASPPPGQGGDGHVNERPISHWVEKFFEYGYVFNDEIRPLLEGIKHLPETTYQLNTFVVRKIFTAEDIPKFNKDYPRLLHIFQDKEARIEDLFLQNLFTGKKMAAEISRLENIIKHLNEEIAVPNKAFENVQTVNYVIPTGEIVRDDGFCYTFNFKTAAGRIYSHMPFYTASVLYEDGKPLLNRVDRHSEIRKSGGGLYSMWPGTIYFSSSDNSDPRTNSCVYSLIVPPYLYFIEKLPPDRIAELGL